MKLSESLQAVIDEHGDRPLMLGELLEVAGEQGFGIVTGAMIIPMLVPIPVPLPGFSAVIGAGIILMGSQIALGFDRPSLPPRLARLALPPEQGKKLVRTVNYLLRPLERVARPRLFRVSHNAALRRFLGLLMVWNALLMSLPLPIPFTNLLPGYTILMQAIALLESDGVLVLLSYGMTAATFGFFFSIAKVIWALVLRMLSTLQQVLQSR